MGGNEFTDGCESVDRELLQMVPEGRPVLVVPTAAADQRPEKAVSNGVAYFSGLGHDAAGLMVVDRKSADDPSIASEVLSAGMVYFTGGSPQKLAAVMHGTRAWGAMTRAWAAGTLMAGSSAGAMVLGPMFKNPRHGWTAGLNLIAKVVVVPHFESVTGPVLDEIELRVRSPVSAIGLKSKHGVLLSGTTLRPLGSSEMLLMRDGRRKLYRPGDEASLTGPVDGPDSPDV
jgi:cyanophycinase